MNRTIRILLIVLDLFLAVTAIAGGIALVAHLSAPALKLLHGSPFHSYLVPGLALMILVGGPAAIASFLLIRRHRYMTVASLVAAFAIVIFETVEIAVIGSDPGVARNLQILYYVVGGSIGAMGVAALRTSA